MARYRPGDQVLFHFHRADLLRLQFRTGAGLQPRFQVVRVLPAGDDGEPSYQVQSQSEPYARVVREHELAPVA